MHRFGSLIKPQTALKKKKKKNKNPKRIYVAERKGEPRKRTMEKELWSVIDGGERKIREESQALPP